MIGIGSVYLVAGLMFAGFSLASLLDRGHPKRVGNAAFWGLFAASFLFGDALGDLANGVLVIALVSIAGAGALGVGSAPRPPAPKNAAHPANDWAGRCSCRRWRFRC